MTTATATAQRSSFGDVLTRIKNWQSLGLLIVLIVFYIVLSISSPIFFTLSNQLAILQNAAFFGIVAFAMTLVIVSGEIDISVGSMAALSSSLLGVFVVNQGVPFPLAVVFVMVIAVGIGAFTGVMRAYFGVPTFISTLAMFLALRGLAQLLTNNFPLPIPSADFFYWGSGKVFGIIPVAAIYFVIAAVVVGIIAQKTVFGRSIYAVGGNAKASTLSGIPVRRVKIVVMMMSAFAASIAGLLQSAQLSSGNSTIAVGLEFDAIAASIIGGTVLSGGKGTIVGTVIGVVFIAALLNGMVLLGVNPYAQQVVRGAVVLIAVLVNVWRTRRAPIS
ncbi:monosaccharide ABC transporter membrane protein (CUT2 family) [Microterricola gilva]|uniref:Monosaccharide ABC transporter membrane protein (CUT2 family) n=1 Tax=Microterricola gilva TaxID=393267 RepID=A0A4Q8AH54_9MICO|nr:ABC transporter permease [Microterricola gilva]RZU63730.1 monosaccharide ABC transporter membrane protein (CUT2 family) [Microterricola gilva]